MFNVVELGEELVDPDTNDVLGYQGIYVGQGRLDRTGDPGTLRMLETEREAVVGNYLMSEEDVQQLNFLPRVPRPRGRRPHHFRAVGRLVDRSIPGRRDQPRLGGGARARPRAARVPDRSDDSRYATWRFRPESAIAGRAGGHDDGVPHVGTLELCPRHGSHDRDRACSTPSATRNPSNSRAPQPAQPWRPTPG